MNRRVITTGLLAGVLCLVWTSISNGLIPIRHELGYKEVPGEAELLQILDAHLDETGLYLVPNDAPPDSLFRARYESGPIYRIHSLQAGAGGTPHVAISVLALLFAPIIPAWLLSLLCERRPVGYGRRVLLVALFGVFVALFSDLRQWGMELVPLNYALFLAASSVITWIVVGLFLAWRIVPERTV